ncbi:MAG: tail fiber domain-containing protein, partial [Solirubrobacterales bacterium]
GGDYSLAAGRRAKANHQGAFVWADSQFSDIASTAANQFVARASGEFFLQSDSTLDDQGGFLNTSTGGFLSTGGMWTNNSDEDLKQGFAAVEPREVLRTVAELPVRTWSYGAEPDVRHIGPTAQDFHRAFGLGGDNRHIGSVDADGVALAAIKGLERIVGSQRERLHAQRASLRSLRARVAALERRGQ